MGVVVVGIMSTVVARDGESGVGNGRLHGGYQIMIKGILPVAKSWWHAEAFQEQFGGGCSGL